MEEADMPQDRVALYTLIQNLDQLSYNTVFDAIKDISANASEAHIGHYMCEYTYYRMTNMGEEPLRDSKNPAALAYVACYVALAKQGTITADKLDKISRQITDECQADVREISQQVIGHTYRAISPYVNESNAKDLFRKLSEGIGGFSIRMKVTLDQASGSALTCYKSVIEAIKAFPTFPWAVIFALFPDEAQSFCNAASRIGGNMYYGFSSNLGVVRSTGYKNIAYTAIKVLIKHKGAKFGSLAYYKGIPTRPDRADILTSIIDTFTPPADIRVPASAQEIIERLARINFEE